MTIDALIVKGNKILLIKRGAETFKDYWALPGGYVDPDEDIRTTVKREVREELNVDAKIVRMLGIYSRPDRSPNQTITAAFETEIKGEPSPGDDAVACKWFDLDNLPAELAFDHTEIIDDFRNGKSAVY